MLDASVAVAWCFEDESNHDADQVLDLMVKATALVPVTWTVEVSNALLAGERRRRSRPADTAQALDLLGSLNIRVDDESAPEPGQLVSLARAERLSVYDALYLWLAIRKGLPLATLDGGLQRASRSAGVKLMIG